MKIVQINAVCETGSTGKICQSVSNYLSGRKIQNYILYSLGNSKMPNAVKISSDRYIKTQAAISRLKGNYGFNSAAATDRMTAYLKQTDPDIVHLHNIHGHDCHLGKLFAYLGSSRAKVVWTFHDCWAFTAYCPHFLTSGCDSWKTGCRSCGIYKKYSLLRDCSEMVFNKKRAVLENADFTIVTPSEWLREQVRQSFLAKHKIEVINNGIDLSVFKPVSSDFRGKLGIPAEKKLVLGAAYRWNNAKGLDAFINLSRKLDASRYQIVLVGTDSKTDDFLPPEIISLPRVESGADLAAIYSAVDVFVNPTKADTFPTVNMEALACGVPVITCRAGGSPEIVSERSGIVVEPDDLDGLIAAIENICERGQIRREDCLKRSKRFAAERQLASYEELYLRMLSRD